MHIIYIYIYMHAVGGEVGPSAGEFGPQTLPAAELSILRGGILAKIDVAKKGPFRPCSWDQIPPYTFFGRKRHFDHRPNFSETSIFIVVSCEIGPFLRNPQKPKRHLPREWGYQRSVLRGGDFLPFSFFFGLIFRWLLLATSDDGGS